MKGCKREGNRPGVHLNGASLKANEQWGGPSQGSVAETEGRTDVSYPGRAEAHWQASLKE